jgi:hypothetical protein
MLMLTLAVGVSYFLPVDYIHNTCAWYAACIASELSVFAIAYSIKTKASNIIMLLCSMLTLGHINGWLFHGYLLESPYHIVVPYLEYLELLSCSLFSTQITNNLKGLVKWIWQR